MGNKWVIKQIKILGNCHLSSVENLINSQNSNDKK